MVLSLIVQVALFIVWREMLFVMKESNKCLDDIAAALDWIKDK